MTTAINPQNPAAIAPPLDLTALGEAANEAARAAVFNTYQQRRAANTLRRQAAGLGLFAEFIRSLLDEVQTGRPELAPAIDAGTLDHLATDPQAWNGITWGLVEGFRNWMLRAGYAVSSANIRLSTVKTYANLAAKAGAITPQEAALIRTVDGFAHKEKPRIDEKRRAAGLPVRTSHKKNQAVRISSSQAEELKQQAAGHPADDPKAGQARRDALLMALLLDHGLRVSEIEALKIQDVDLGAGEICFYRPKVDNRGCHTLSRDALTAAEAYIRLDLANAAPDAPLFKASHKSGKLSGQMSTRAINKRVGYLAAQIGLAGLSPHDCRHYAATKDARAGKPIEYMMQKYGWSSPAMAIRYIEAAHVVKVE